MAHRPALDVDDPAARVARRRLLEGLLAWGQPRPPVPVDLVARLRAELEDGLAGLDLGAVAASEPAGRLVVTKRRLDRRVCDGYQLEPRPYAHGWAGVRGALVHKAIERDWWLRERPAGEVVARAWQELATDRPGDPGSLGAWLNARTGDEVGQLRGEAVQLLEGFREVWPPLPHVEVVAEPRLRVPLAGGRVVLQGAPDVLLRSPVRDRRCRTLLVDCKTGRPRSEQDRRELRFYALLVTLAEDRPPFRWATFSVTEGRAEWEDLDEDALLATARRVLDGVRQAVRLASAGEGDLRLSAGPWCALCAREDTCGVAAEARRARVSHAPGMLGP